MKRKEIWWAKRSAVSYGISAANTEGVHNIRGKSPQRRWILYFGMVLSVAASLPHIEAQNSDGDYCLTREGRVSVIGGEITALYERKLFVTDGDLARYVFLTNANYNGDSSTALYRAPAKEGSLHGGYWVTSTEVSTSLRVNPNPLKVRRADAPLRASTAVAVNELWVALLERSRVNERAVPSAPTAIISARTMRGSRLKAVTTSLEDGTPCIALARLGQLLINYPQLPTSRRDEAARKIEQDARRLLARVNRAR